MCSFFLDLPRVSLSGVKYIASLNLPIPRCQGSTWAKYNLSAGENRLLAASLSLSRLLLASLLPVSTRVEQSGEERLKTAFVYFTTFLHTGVREGRILFSSAEPSICLLLMSGQIDTITTGGGTLHSGLCTC